MNRRAVLLGGTAIAALGVAAFAMRQTPGSTAAEGRPPAEAGFDLTEAEWRAKLNENQYAVLREAATERPFSSPLNDEHREGTFDCAGCALPLFDSATKYDSGTGWPSFYQPLDNAVGEDDRLRDRRRAHRGPLPPLRRSSGPRVQRRSRSPPAFVTA